ncbi:MAG: ABC transporter substrate-binding protein [Alphaproteobacteria bacterium]
MFLRTRMALIAGLLAALPFLAAPAHAENVLRWASQGDALTFDPHAQNETPTTAANLQVYEPLVMRGPLPDLDIIPALAASWKLVEPTVWEFKLRKGVTFHDGTPFTAEDVAFSIARAQHETSDYKTYVETVEEVRIVDDHTVRIVTDVPTPLLTANLTQVFIMSKAWSEKHDVTRPQDWEKGEENYAVRHANGTGAFVMELREPDIRTILTKNKNWWGLKEYPHNIDRIIYTPIQNDATRVAALLSGEIQFLLDPPLQNLKQIERQATLHTRTTPQTRTIFLGMDQERDELRSSNIKGKNPFADVRVRKAFYHAIDAPAIVKKIMRGKAKPAGVLIAPAINGYTEELDNRLPHDVKKAKTLLRQAGYPDGFKVKLDCPNDRYINDEAICQAVTGMLGKIGVDVELDAQPKSLHFPKLLNHDTDFYLLGWGVVTIDSEYVFAHLYRTGEGWNAGKYSNPRVDKLIEQMTSETDPEKRDALIAKTWEIVEGDVVYLPLHHQVITWAMAENFDMPIMPDDMPRFFWGKFR